MRLIDIIAQGRSARWSSLGGVELPGANAFELRIRACPLRYVLADDLVACATQLAFAEGDRLSSCLDLIRVPAQTLWVEWADAPRHNALRAIPALRVPADGAARRAGALINAAANGRSGHIRTFWSTVDDVAFLSPLVMLFDLDGIPTVGEAPPDNSFQGDTTLRLEGEPAVEELLVACNS